MALIFEYNSINRVEMKSGVLRAEDALAGIRLEVSVPRYPSRGIRLQVPVLRYPSRGIRELKLFKKGDVLPPS